MRPAIWIAYSVDLAVSSDGKTYSCSVDNSNSVLPCALVRPDDAFGTKKSADWMNIGWLVLGG